MATERSPPSRRNHTPRKNDYFPSHRLRKSKSPSPRSSSDSIKTFTDLGQKENNQEEACFTTKNTSTTRTPASVSKNFMSPTISASSKFTSSPRKNNISADRNDAPSLHLFADRTNLDHHRHHHHNKLAASIESRSSSKDLLRSSSSMTMNTKLDAFFHSQIEARDPHSEHGLNVNGDDPAAMSSFSSASSVVTDIDPCLLLHPYHPKTNYLSPRPRFLHYRPRPRLGSYLRSHKSSGEDDDDDDICYDHESDDDQDSASEQVVESSCVQLISPTKTKAFVEDDSTVQQKPRISARLVLSCMIMVVLTACLCLSVIDSSFLTLQGGIKEGSGYGGEEVWRNVSKSDHGVDLWNMHKLRDEWSKYSKSFFFFTTNTTFSNEDRFILPGIQNPLHFSEEIDGRNVNSLRDDGITIHMDVSPLFLENEAVIHTELSECRGEDEVVLNSNPPSDHTEENLKKVHIFPEIEDGVELQISVEDFPSQSDESVEEPKLHNGTDEMNEVKPEEATEIQKPAEEEDQFLILSEAEEVIIKAEPDDVNLEEVGEEVKTEENEIQKPVTEEEIRILNSSGEVKIEENEIQKPVAEEHQILYASGEAKIEENETQKPEVEELRILNASEEGVHRGGDVFGRREGGKMTELSKETEEEDSMNLVGILVTIVGCCVAAIGAAVATMVHKGSWFSIRGAGGEVSGTETARKKTKKSKRGSLSSSSNFNTTPCLAFSMIRLSWLL